MDMKWKRRFFLIWSGDILVRRRDKAKFRCHSRSLANKLLVLYQMLDYFQCYNGVKRIIGKWKTGCVSSLESEVRHARISVCGVRHDIGIVVDSDNRGRAILGNMSRAIAGARA